MSYHPASMNRGHWSYATVRSDKPLGVGLVQVFLGISRTFLNIEGQWKELDADPMELVQQMGRDGWELVNRTDETTPHNRLLTQWTFKKWIPQEDSSSYSSRAQSVQFSPEQRNARLEQAAAAFLNAGDSTKAEYQRTLIQSGEAAVYPLLYALVNLFSRHARRPDLSGDQTRYAWGQVLLRSEVRDVLRVSGQIGELASRKLCHALRDRDITIRLSAALLLGIDDNPSYATLAEIERVVDDFHVRYNSKLPEHEKTFGLLLAFTLAVAGHRQWRERLDEWVQDGAAQTGHQPQMSYQEWKEGMIDQVLVQLLKVSNQ
ncbi:MAG: hypothetical protein KatS3mg050_0699 [Litorilinea sp.]|nr:MAG: hypothetical protein KatS3mg050_0699 [Litorilinea sp.]